MTVGCCGKTYTIAFGSLPTGVAFGEATNAFAEPDSPQWQAVFAPAKATGAGGIPCWGMPALSEGSAMAAGGSMDTTQFGKAALTRHPRPNT